MRQRKHLRRLDRIFERYSPPVFLINGCVRDRAPVLANRIVADVLEQAWRDAENVHRWLIGRYVIMPDHVHFFCTPLGDARKDLGQFIENWKRWTRKGIREGGLERFAWQPEFFDHLMRSSESYASKWQYVRDNPVRAALVARAEDWPYQGEIHQI